ncbi:hypothetical protein ACHAWF_006404, partial [Thalassiosira exigua]
MDPSIAVASSMNDPMRLQRTSNSRHRRRSSSGDSAPGADLSNSGRHSLHSIRSLTRENKGKSQLHLLSKKGITHRHEMNALQRYWKFFSLPNLSEYLMSVDHHQIWRRHLAWSLRDGDHLKNAVTSRFASNMVFMSLLLGTEIGVLFSPSKPADAFRLALQNKSWNQLNFWAAILLCTSIGLTLSTLVANFTAWAIIGAVSPHNAHAILRSSVGLDAAQFPARLVILSIYCFVGWIVMFMFTLLPLVAGIVIAVCTVSMIGYIVILYSSFGRLVIYSRAMRHREIFDGEEDNHMSSKRLFEELLKMAEKEKAKGSPLPLYYRSKRELSEKISYMRAQEEQEYEDMGFGSEHASRYVENILSSSGHHDMPDRELEEILRSTSQASLEEGSPVGGGGRGRHNGAPQVPPFDSAMSSDPSSDALERLPPLGESTGSLGSEGGRVGARRKASRTG